MAQYKTERARKRSCIKGKSIELGSYKSIKKSKKIRNSMKRVITKVSQISLEELAKKTAAPAETIKADITAATEDDGIIVHWVRAERDKFPPIKLHPPW